MAEKIPEYTDAEQAIWDVYGNKTVEYKYNAPALSCCMNGKSMKGKGKVTDLDIGGGLVIDGRLRIFEREVIRILRR